MRSEREGLGIVTDTTSNHLTIRALSNQDLISHIFAIAGISAKPSPSGLVARRLIKQMGGLDGCRVFKIAGVRNLIGRYGPMQSFTRGGAIQTIGNNDPETGLPRFKDFEGLFIEQREQAKLKPEHAFTYLLKKGVFHAGLKLLCVHCQLELWVALDDIATVTKCDLCGGTFDITPQLHDRDWAYRRSGLFGRDDHQHGAIPVVLVLQQISTVLTDNMIYATSMNLTPTTANIGPCETDFVVVSRRSYEDTVPLAIGECKTMGDIDEADVQNLKRVADAFPKSRIKPFIVFAKTGTFTPAEIARCRAADEPNQHRVIMLSDRELEPYFVYERSQKEFEIDSAAISFHDLAMATQNIYLDPKPKRKVQEAPN